jgi:hypothetical protein
MLLLPLLTPLDGAARVVVGEVNDDEVVRGVAATAASASAEE